MRIKTTPAIDRTTTLDVNGSSQRIRVCAAREDLPPLLVVQGGPALPVLHEVAKFQRLLNLEQDFLVGYWDQRGCGDAPRKDADSVSWRQQIDDLRTVLTWVHAETKQGVTMLGISIGGTMALRAAEHEPSRVKAVVAISPDSHTAGSDAASYHFLQEQARRGGSRRLSRRVAKLKPPPYLSPAAFQRRAGLLADLGTIAQKDVRRVAAGDAGRHDCRLRQRRHHEGPAQHESRAATPAARDRLTGSVCQSTPDNDPGSLRVRRAGRAESTLDCGPAACRDCGPRGHGGPRA